jgi:hypothetical protein
MPSHRHVVHNHAKAFRFTATTMTKEKPNFFQKGGNTLMKGRAARLETG